MVLIFQVVLKENGGLLNNLLSFLTGQQVAVGWLSDARFSKFGATILNLWQNMGYAMLFGMKGKDISLSGWSREL